VTMDTLQAVLADHPRIENWNEAVLQKPDNLADIVQAVCYVESGDSDGTERYWIKREAKHLGKALLKLVHPHDVDRFQFVCDTADGIMPA
jgi:hypothetical protein